MCLGSCANVMCCRAHGDQLPGTREGDKDEDAEVALAFVGHTLF